MASGWRQIERRECNNPKMKVARFSPPYSLPRGLRGCGGGRGRSVQSGSIPGDPILVQYPEPRTLRGGVLGEHPSAFRIEDHDAPAFFPAKVKPVAGRHRPRSRNARGAAGEVP